MEEGQEALENDDETEMEKKKRGGGGEEFRNEGAVEVGKKAELSGSEKEERRER